MNYYLPFSVMGVHSTTCQSNHPRRYLRLLVASIFPSFFMDAEDASRIYPLSKSSSFVLHDTANSYVQATMAESLGKCSKYEQKKFFRSEFKFNHENEKV